LQHKLHYTYNVSLKELMNRLQWVLKLTCKFKHGLKVDYGKYSTRGLQKHGI